MTALVDHTVDAVDPLPTRPAAEATVPPGAASAAEPPARGKLNTRLRRLPRALERLVGVVILFAIWELAAQVGWLSPRVLAGPSTVLTAGYDMVRAGTLTDALWVSVQRVAWGLGIGIPIGVVLALAAGLTRVGNDLFDANVQMLRFVPIIALQPLLILWLGIGDAAKISLIVLGVMFPIYVNTHSAITSLDPRYLELAEVVELSRWQLVRRIVLPGALPGFLVGLRMATAVAWLLLVFAEQMNASSGLGYLMIKAQTFFQSDVIVVVLVSYAVLGLISDTAVRALERRLLRWRPVAQAAR